MGPVMIGMAAAAVSGLLAIRVLLGYVRTRDYRAVRRSTASRSRRSSGLRCFSAERPSVRFLR